MKLSKLTLDMTFRIKHGRKVMGKVTKSTEFIGKDLGKIPWYVLHLGCRLAQDAFNTFDALKAGGEDE